MNYYGIDLGTSNCLISKVISNLDDTFDVKCLTDDEGEDSFPSVVYFENEQNYKVGEKARKHLFTEPDSTVELIKIRLGKTHKIQVKTPNSRFEKSPQEISSYLLKHFNTIHSDNIENVVVTVPAFFDQNQKEATMQAGIIADIKPQSLIEEPTAAIMYHIFSEYKAKGINFMNMPQKNVLVFDFGGGTLDLSLIELRKNDDEIILKFVNANEEAKEVSLELDKIELPNKAEVALLQPKDGKYIKPVANGFVDPNGPNKAISAEKISNFDLCQKRFPEEVDFSVENKTLSNKIVVPAKSVLVLKF